MFQPWGVRVSLRTGPVPWTVGTPMTWLLSPGRLTFRLAQQRPQGVTLHGLGHRRPAQVQDRGGDVHVAGQLVPGPRLRARG